MSEKKELIRICDLAVGFKDKEPLFNKLNLALISGEMVCFMGPNGIGKTSLIRTLAGIQNSLDGKIVKDHGTNISLVLTDKITSGMMTVFDLVAYGRYPHLGWDLNFSEKDYSIINEAIEKVRIKSLTHKKLFELSDGQLQMAMIAKALAQDTPVMFLDEPTAHLDLNNRVEIMNTLRELSRTTNKSILIATHELDLALQTADKLWLATANKSIKAGVPEDLVLDGSFDEVFKLKGFDLKTGKLHPIHHRNVKVKVSGNGHELLWTKNALERCGYEIDQESPLEIKLLVENGNLKWLMTSPSIEKKLNNIEALIDALNSLGVNYN